MCIIKFFKEMKKRRRDRIYEGPCEDGGVVKRSQADVPKTINSIELVSFSCRFSTLSLIDLEPPLSHCVYSFSATVKEGNVICTLSAQRRQEGSFNKELTREVKFMDELEKLLRSYEVAKFNGYYHSVSGLPAFYGCTLDAKFASGENVHFYDNQDTLLGDDFITALYKLFDVK